MRKRSRSKASLDVVDRALQDFYRAKYPKAKCEVCGRLAQVRHHHILKSKSNYLRFNEKNLIALCYFCHSKIAFGDIQVIAKYSVKRGIKWVKMIEKLEKIKKQYYTKIELEELVKKYEM